MLETIPAARHASAGVSDLFAFYYLGHDFLYSRHLLSRRMSDAVLLEACRAAGIPWYRRWPMCIDVGVFGWSNR
jgi:hypothetical protein